MTFLNDKPGTINRHSAIILMHCSLFITTLTLVTENSMSKYIVFVVPFRKYLPSTRCKWLMTGDSHPAGSRSVLGVGVWNVELVSTRSWRERERKMFYFTTHSTDFIYGYMASDIWLRTILIVRKETRCRHIGYSYRLTAKVLLYAPSHRQDNTYHGLCYTSRGTLAGTRNRSMGPPHEGSIRRPIAPWANTLPLSYVPLPRSWHVIEWSFKATSSL